jgi:hypothetical protein
MTSPINSSRPQLYLPTFETRDQAVGWLCRKDKEIPVRWINNNTAFHLGTYNGALVTAGIGLLLYSQLHGGAAIAGGIMTGAAFCLNMFIGCKVVSKDDFNIERNEDFALALKIIATDTELEKEGCYVPPEVVTNVAQKALNASSADLLV